MSRMCPGCKREIDDNARFCPFCATFTGEKKKEKKKSRVGSIIGGVSGAVVLGGIALAVLAFDAFGIFKNEPEHLTGTGDKLFNLSLSPAKSGDKWGYIDRSGKFVIKPQFDCAYPFDENINGTAAVSNENGYGFINDKGEFTIAVITDFRSLRQRTDICCMLTAREERHTIISILHTPSRFVTGRIIPLHILL